MTIWPAWQHFEEDTKGTIEVGKLADFVILSDNPLAVPQDQLADIKVLETIKEGKSIYQRPAGEANLSSPAMFGLTRHDGHGLEYAVPGMQYVYGDGCFNHGLSVLVQALENARASKSGAPNL
jgi:hypothetical protein